MNIYSLFQTCKDKYVLLKVLKQKPNLNIKNSDGYTIPMLAFKHSNDKDVLLKILKQKPNLEIQCNHGMNISMYAFMYCKDKDVLLELLKQKPKLYIPNYQRYTIPMFAFMFCKDRDVLLELFKYRLNLNIKNDNDDMNVIMYAFEYYVDCPEFDFNVLEKLYNRSSLEYKQLFNSEYNKLKKKYKMKLLILFRHQKRYGVTKN